MARASFPDDPEMRVSHETIYLSLFVQSRGALRKELTRYLRTGRRTRRPLGHTVINGQGQLRGTVHISERPPRPPTAPCPGTGKATCCAASASTAIATLVERHSRFTLLVALPNGTAPSRRRRARRSDRRRCPSSSAAR